MISTTFEVTTLAHAVQAAARIAPNKGSAFDKAAGIVLELDQSATEQAVVKSTNIDVTYRQAVPVLSWAGDPKAIWRLPADLFAGTCAHLPIESGAQVVLGQKDAEFIHLKSGKTKAKLRQILGLPYPEFNKFDDGDLCPVAGFARRINQVSWAVNRKAQNVLSGVHMDGKRLVATDGNMLAVAPCLVPVEQPITAPLHLVAMTIRNAEEVLLGAIADRLHLMTDQDTQITSTLIAGNYPNADQLLDIDRPHSFKFPREALEDAIDRLLVVVKGEREIPRMIVETSPGLMKLTCQVEGVGTITDELDIDGGIDHKFVVTPTWLLSGIRSSDRGSLTFRHLADPLKPFSIEDDDGYVAVIGPRA